VQCVDVGVNVLAFGVGDVEVDIHGLNASLAEVGVDVFDGFDAVDKADFQLFGGTHADDALHHEQNQNDEQAADNGDQVVAITDCYTQTCDIPQGCGCCKAGDLAVREHDCACAQETDAADDLCAQTAEVVGNRGVRIRVNVGSEVGFDQRDDTRAQTDENVRAHAGGTALDFAFDTDDCTDQNGKRDTQNDDRILHEKTS